MDKTLIVFACLCGFAAAQFNNFGSFGASSNAGAYNNYNRGQQPQNRQVQEAPRPTGVCKELNERYPVSGSCDKYVECLNGTAEEKLCPDGLRFNPNVNFNVYPCQYPNEVSCLERSALQPAQPTEQCEHQFGYYKLGDTRNCSYFRNCVNGVGYDFQCPEGLAWSSSSYRCEWPDEVDDCDAEAFLGFRCPEVPVSKELGAPAGFRYYRAENNCQKYFLCIGSKPRVLFCGTNTGYDELTNTCVSADEVPACPSELRAQAARVREEEKQLLAKELEFNAKTTNKRRNIQVILSEDAQYVRSPICQQKNGYYKVDASCDAYVECLNYQAIDMVCPDGLHYDLEAKWPGYPCGYPMDVPCVGRGAAQAAQPTAECPHQYGYFPSPLATVNCGQYRMCIGGKAIEMNCPAGLAFNPESGRCDWPDQVPSCKADDFLGFSCPAPPVDADGAPLDVVLNYKYNNNCYYFFSCAKGHARLLACDEGLAFDPASGKCIEAEYVDCGSNH
ncbi:unnamed protein product [Spodoptera littoralis]|uniref:Chitin-binding type-2 domain-containing protein n=1 Tax=Spodoptera littoralis TaxID=7109 RepID=A0A9P0IBB5_SPOLI|nr:unnamed protein product [Spodoptera littoralis]CAH1643585.1 unnamed protein product [Spodoptera littoralis]